MTPPLAAPASPPPSPLTRVERWFAWLELATGSTLLAQGVRMWVEVLAPTPNPDFPSRGMAGLLTLPIVPWGLFGFMLPGALLLARVRWTQFLAVLAVIPLLALGTLWAIEASLGLLGISPS
jgi:hypothetical protein